MKLNSGRAVFVMLALAFEAAGFASPRENVKIADCVRTDDRAHAVFEKHVRLFVYNDSVSPYQSQNRPDLDALERDDFQDVVSLSLQNDSSNDSYSIYSKRNLQDVKRSASATQIVKLPKELPKELNKEFAARFEDRDYDSDYSGIFYWLHGFVVRDRAKYDCRLSN